MSRLPSNAYDLHEYLLPFGPAVDGRYLTLARQTPAEIRPILRLPSTGVRAVILGRTWLGKKPSGHGVSLNPRQRLPLDVNGLCVAGDGSIGGSWHAVRDWDREEHPALFGDGKGERPRFRAEMAPATIPMPRVVVPLVVPPGECEMQCTECRRTVFIGPLTPAEIAEGCERSLCPLRPPEERRKAA